MLSRNLTQRTFYWTSRKGLFFPSKILALSKSSLIDGSPINCYLEVVEDEKHVSWTRLLWVLWHNIKCRLGMLRSSAGKLCCTQDNNPSEESVNQTEIDTVGDVPNTTRAESNREKQSTQYLTRFDNVPTSSGQGGERFYWFSNQYKLIQRDTWWNFLEIQYMRALARIYSHRVPGF